MEQTELTTEVNDLFIEAFPVSFRILNDKHEEKIYLENKPASGLLELSNDSGQEINFVQVAKASVAGPDNFHFKLRFRPGILKSDTKSLIKNKLIKKGWALSIGLESLKGGKVQNLPVLQIPMMDLVSATATDDEINKVKQKYAKDFDINIQKFTAELLLSIEESTVVLYFLNNDQKPFKKDEKIILPLKHLNMDCEQGTQVTQVELECCNLTLKADAGQTTDGSEATDDSKIAAGRQVIDNSKIAVGSKVVDTGKIAVGSKVVDSSKAADKITVLESHIRHFSLTIVNHRGNPHMPIHVGFTGFNAILNDGQSSNTLNLRITNLQKRTPESKGTFTFSHDKHSKIYLYFDTDAESSDYAISAVDHVAAFELDIKVPKQKDDNHLEHEPMFQGNTPIWEIMPDYGDVVLQPHLTVLPQIEGAARIADLPDDSCLDITLSDIVTDYFMGVTNLYLRFENIPGYWDHTYAIPIVKQPMVYVNIYNLYRKEGDIGSLYTETKNILSKFNLGELTDDNWTDIILINQSRTIAEQIKKEFIDAEINVSLRRTKEERVGIGTTNPQNKFDVNGSIAVGANYAGSKAAPYNGAIIEGSVGIGTTSPNLNNKLSVQGNADVSGNLGIGTSATNYKLEVNGTGKFSNNVRIIPNDAKWAEGLQFYMPNTVKWGGLRWSRNRVNYDGNFYIGYTALDATDDLVFGANNQGSQIDNILRLTKNGNVGIGTNDPITTLQVDGDVLLAKKGFSVSEIGPNWRNVAIGKSAALLKFVGYYSSSNPVVLEILVDIKNLKIVRIYEFNALIGDPHFENSVITFRITFSDGQYGIMKISLDDHELASIKIYEPDGLYFRNFEGRVSSLVI